MPYEKVKIMKFIYFAPIIDNEFHPTSASVAKKITTQVSELSKLNIDVHLVTTKDIDFPINPKNTKISRVNLLVKLRRPFRISKVLTNLIEYLPKESIIYLRYPYPMFFCLYIPLNKGKICKVITEHNNIEPKSLKLSLHSRKFNINGIVSFIYLTSIYILDLIFGKHLRKYADAFVGVTDEITEYQISIVGELDKPHISIGNGINVSSVGLRVPPNFSETLNLLFIANVSRWHGIDRLIKGLADYEGDTKAILHIAGEGLELENLKKLSRKYQLEEDVLFYGFLKGDSLDELFDMCHIAIGTLGMHRKGLSMTSELKIREYAARGIPFICSADDQDFANGFSYMMKVPSDENPIDIEEVIRFAEDVYSDPDHHLKMRAYAEENLDWSVKMKKLKKFCDSLIAE